MLIVLTVNLYTSRIVLSTLGVEDFGVFNVVAGIVVLFAFLNTTMSGATSRFITVGIGKNDDKLLHQTFQTSMFLHIIIALLIILICETLGIWFLNNKLVIPPDRLITANWVFQLATMTIVFKVLQVPFNASMIANERMGIYAVIEICNVVITLICVLLLKYCTIDKLIAYSSILTIVAFVIFISYAIIGHIKFKECQFKAKPEKNILKNMAIFSGWDLYGNLCVAGRTQGISFTLNIFFGTLINAANGIATQIQSAILQLSNNVIAAFRPQIIILYTKKEISEMQNLIQNSTKISIFLYSLAAIPLIIEMPYILDLWLVNPPEYSVQFSRISTIMGLFQLFISISNIPIHATGKIKLLSFISGTIFILTVPIAYICLNFINDPNFAYVIMLLFTIINMIAVLFILKRRILSFSIKKYILSSIIVGIVIFIVSLFATIYITVRIETDFIRLITTIITSATITTVLSILLVLPKSFVSKIKQKIWKI